ncbi:MAG TPA: YigZ family protein [bacterium]|jgi:uncharacterized YigZ family protein
MSAEDYLTLAGPGHAQTRVLGSRFLGTATPVQSEQEVAALLDAERKRYYDATHWCFAYRLGRDRHLIEKPGDAGEPRGTAGPPILREIQKRDLTSSLVIVTRYFGGTKLGTGGLARAYGDCAAQCLDAAPVLRVPILSRCRVECSYDLQNAVYTIARRHNAAVELQPSSAGACFLLSISPDAMPALIAALIDAGSGRMLVQEISE